MNIAIRIILGSIFIIAGLGKTIFPYEFAALITSYNMLPTPLATAYAVIVPPVEILAGGLVIFRVYTRYASMVLALLAVSFIIANTYQIAIGAGGDDCGCFGPLVPMNVWQSLCVDVLLVVMAVRIYFSGKVKNS